MTDDENKILKPYVSALGELVVEWNQMLESLGKLFGSILYPAEPIPPVAWAVWHSTNNDRAKIAMLRDAARAKFGEIGKDSQNSQAWDDIDWLCGRVTSIFDERNNSIHAPIAIRRDNLKNKVEVVASDFFGNPRARRLSGKELLSEYEWQTANAKALKLLARNMVVTILYGPKHRAWPVRPQLPNRGQKKL